MRIKNVTTNRIVADSAKRADTVASRCVGLMFSKPSRTALVLEFPQEQKISLHMAFVFYSIDVIFVNGRKKVVDVKKGFRPFSFYASSKKAVYAIELPAGTVEKTMTREGHEMEFE